jgi:hypothetical protein
MRKFGLMCLTDNVFYSPVPGLDRDYEEKKGWTKGSGVSSSIYLIHEPLYLHFSHGLVWRSYERRLA